jgi:hypothetical protein
MSENENIVTNCGMNTLGGRGLSGGCNILKESVLRMWIGFLGHRLRPMVGVCEGGNEPPFSTKFP